MAKLSFAASASPKIVRTADSSQSAQEKPGSRKSGPSVGKLRKQKRAAQSCAASRVNSRRLARTFGSSTAHLRSASRCLASHASGLEVASADIFKPMESGKITRSDSSQQVPRRNYPTGPAIAIEI